MAEPTDNQKSTTPTTQVVTSGGTIRIETPAGKKRRKSSRAIVIDSADDVVDGFVSFLREYSVVGLAIGFVIGLQAQVLVKQLVASFIDPLFKLLFGKTLSQRSVELHFHGNSATFAWGSFAYGLLNFLFVLAMIYLIVKAFKLDKLKQAEAAEEKE